MLKIKDSVDLKEWIKMYSKEEFNKVWKDSNRQSILNQFYYEHKKLQEVLSVLGEVREYCLEKAKGRLERTLYDDILKILDKVGDIK